MLCASTQLRRVSLFTLAAVVLVLPRRFLVCLLLYLSGRGRTTLPVRLCAEADLGKSVKQAESAHVGLAL